MRTQAWYGSAAAIVLLASMPAIPARADLGEVVAATYEAFSMSPPTLDNVVICHGFGCTHRTEVALTNKDRAVLTELFAGAKASAAAERQAIGKAGAWFDRRIGPEAGTQNHVARAAVPHMFDAGQFDCIDTSRNMTTLLLLLDQMKLLRHHSVDLPASRGHLVDGRALHVTAVLTEKTGARWAVDAWTRGYGQAPEIMPLSLWMRSN